MHDYIIFDEIVSTEPSSNWLDYLGQSSVNLVNLHASIYGLLLVHSDDEMLNENEQAELNVASEALKSKVSYDDLYNIMGEDVASYEYDAQSTLKYARRIIEFLKEV